MTQNQATSILRSTNKKLRLYRPTLVQPKQQAPVLAETHFKEDVKGLFIRLIDLDFGSWAFALVRPNKYGILHAEKAYWIGVKVDAKELLYCPGCAVVGRHQCRHAPNYQSIWVQPDKIVATLESAVLSRLKCA